MSSSIRFDHKSWLMRRKVTFVAFLLEMCALGMEYSLTFVTLWIYLNDVIRTTHPKFFYSIISAIYLISLITSSFVFSHFSDQYRNTRLLMFVGNTLAIVGNILYTIPWSPWYLFYGRLLSGCAGSLRPIIISETARTFEDEKLGGKYSSLGMAFALGFVSGPLLNLPFKNINFVVIGVRITYVNGAGLLLAFIFILVLLLTVVTVSNLSQEYDMKKSILDEEKDASKSLMTNEDNFNGDECDKNPSRQEITQWCVVKTLATNKDVVFLLFLSFYFMFTMVLFDLWLPMFAREYLHYGLAEISYIVIGFGACSVFQLAMLALKPVKRSNLVLLAVCCMVSQMLVFSIFMIFMVDHEHPWVNAILWIAWCFFGANVIAIEEIFLVTSMAAKIPSEVQASCESVRLAFTGFGSTAAMLSGAFLLSYMYYTSMFCIVLLFISLVILLSRKSYIINDKIKYEDFIKNKGK